VNLDAGEAFLQYGTDSGAASRGIVEADRFRQPDSDAGAALQGSNSGDLFGSSVGPVGDVNGDGLVDLGIGAPGFDGAPGEDSGALYVDFGTQGQLQRGVIEADSIGSEIPGAVYQGEAAGDQAGSSVATVGDMDGDGEDDFLVGAPGHDAGGSSDAGASYLQTENPDPVPSAPTTAPLASGCDSSGCTVTDLETGAQLEVYPGSLGRNADLAVTGLLSPADLPVAAPAGFTLLGSGDFDPDGQLFGSPYPDAHLPVRPELQDQLTLGEVFDILALEGETWTDTGRDGTVELNPVDAGRRSVGADLSTQPLRVLAVFLPDLDGDGTRDSLDADRDGDGVPNGSDGCPDTADPFQHDCDSDGTGDLCDPDTVDADGDGADDACDNCLRLSNADQADGDLDGQGDPCDPCPAENPDDADGDGICCPEDNCCGVANPSQADRDGNGAGDACDIHPVLVVSSDSGDDPDFATIAAAVAAAVQSGTRIEIHPGLGPYNESVVVNRGMALSFVGVSGGPAVEVDGGSGAAFDLLSTAADAPMTFANLTLSGQKGIRSDVPVEARGLTFVSISAEALDLDAGAHRVEEITVDAKVTAGLDLAAGSQLELRLASLEGLAGTAFALSGTALVENTLLAGSNEGIVLGASGSLELRYATVAGHTGAGVDNTLGGSVTVSRSILWGNGSGDLINVACASVDWSDTGTPDCSSVNDNLSADPLLDSFHHLGDGSPALDHGPDPSGYQGDPPTDRGGGPRLRDFDEDGLARSDPGAFEREGTASVPAVANLGWSDDDTLSWDAEPTAVEYHLYRDDAASLSWGHFGTCRDDLDANRTDTTATDPAVPAVGEAFSYLITAEDGLGQESSLGLASGAERSNFSSCP
jgi:hypothetical protein